MNSRLLHIFVAYGVYTLEVFVFNNWRREREGERESGRKREREREIDRNKIVRDR